MQELNARRQLEADLSELTRMLMRLSKMAEEALARSVWALKNQDVETARNVLDKDDALDQLTGRIDVECMNFVARFQPLGEDLRTVTSIMHMAVDLERIGDYGGNIARAAIELAGKELMKPLIDIPRMTTTL